MAKIGLVGVFANMQADVEIIMKVFALGERILSEAYNQQLILALIKSLTTLAVSCKFAVSELVVIQIMLGIWFRRFCSIFIYFERMYFIKLYFVLYFHFHIFS